MTTSSQVIGGVMVLFQTYPRVMALASASKAHQALVNPLRHPCQTTLVIGVRANPDPRWLLNRRALRSSVEDPASKARMVLPLAPQTARSHGQLGADLSQVLRPNRRANLAVCVDAAKWVLLEILPAQLMRAVGESLLPLVKAHLVCHLAWSFYLFIRTDSY